MSKDLQNNMNTNESGKDTGQKILERVSQYHVPLSITKQEALMLLKEKIKNNSSRIKPLTGSKSARILYWYAAAAAGVLLLFGLWYFMVNPSTTTIMVAKGEHINYQLPDGSVVALNAESKISFKKETFMKKRYLEMEGEAFFNIQKGGAFTIRTKSADITILGTSFNVFAREASFKVSCVTGKIKVSSASQALIITPGESAVVSNESLSKFPDKNILNVANWRNGEFYYENAPLNLVLKEIERQFNVTFEIPKMKMKFYTGSFNSNNLTNALDVVCIPMKLDYEIGSNGKILIREMQK
jgi:transmembrane sensor